MEKLSLKDLIEGATLCLQNSLSLIEEGDILFKYKKYNRSYFLYQTAQEETAKGKDIVWCAFDNIIGLKRNFSEIKKSFFEHGRKYRTNFITLTIFEKESISAIENLMEITCNAGSLEEAKEGIKKYVINSKLNDRVDRINKFCKTRIQERNDSLYVNYNEKDLFNLKSFEKEQLQKIRQETKQLLGDFVNELNLIKDNNWQKRGEELGEIIKNYWANLKKH